MDTTYYRDRILRMLNDEEFYGETKQEMDSQTRKLINKLVETHGKWLFDEEADYLANVQHNTGFFYGFPKEENRSKKIVEAIKEQNSEYIKVFQPDDFTFRPIVGSPNCRTQRHSHLLDLCWNRFVRKSLASSRMI